MWNPYSFPILLTELSVVLELIYQGICLMPVMDHFHCMDKVRVVQLTKTYVSKFPLINRLEMANVLFLFLWHVQLSSVVYKHMWVSGRPPPQGMSISTLCCLWIASGWLTSQWAAEYSTSQWATFQGGLGVLRLNKRVGTSPLNRWTHLQGCPLR